MERLNTRFGVGWAISALVCLSAWGSGADSPTNPSPTLTTVAIQGLPAAFLDVGQTAHARDGCVLGRHHARRDSRVEQFERLGAAVAVPEPVSLAVSAAEQRVRRGGGLRAHVRALRVRHRRQSNRGQAGCAGSGFFCNDLDQRPRRSRVEAFKYTSKSRSSRI